MQRTSMIDEIEIWRVTTNTQQFWGNLTWVRGTLLWNIYLKICKNSQVQFSSDSIKFIHKMKRQRICLNSSSLLCLLQVWQETWSEFLALTIFQCQIHFHASRQRFYPFPEKSYHKIVELFLDPDTQKSIVLNFWHLWELNCRKDECEIMKKKAETA